MFAGPSVWHKGEIKAQAALDYLRASSGGYNAIESQLPLEHRQLLEELRFLPVASLDLQGRPWASLLTCDGSRGFVSAPYNYRIRVKGTSTPGDPIQENLDSGHRVLNKHLVAGVALSLENRRRNKFGGYLESVDFQDGQYEMDIRINTALGNCPKYIAIRELEAKKRTSTTEVLSNSQLGDSPLPHNILDHIAKADSLYMATAYLPKDDEEESHLGINHRGGYPGFLRVDPVSKSKVYLPDWSGNRFMQSIGNMEETPLAGFTIPDWQSGNVLYLTGTVKQYFGKQTAAGAIMRSVHAVTELQVTAYTFARNALPLQQVHSTSYSTYTPPVRLLNAEAGLKSVEQPECALSAAFSSFELLTEDLATITFTVSAASPTAFKDLCASYRPGQYAVLDCSAFLDPATKGYKHMARYTGGEQDLNDDGIRTWSVSSWQPDEASEKINMSITIRKKATGRITPTLFAFGSMVNEKDGGNFTGQAAISLPLLGIAGTFCQSVKAGKELYLAGGIGVTPFLPMIEARRHQDDIILILSCRSIELSAFEKMVADSISKSPYENIKVKYHLTGETSVDASELYHLGRITASSLAALDLEERRISRILLCGSESYAKGVMVALEGNGVNGNEVHRESFAY